MAAIANRQVRVPYEGSGADPAMIEAQLTRVLGEEPLRWFIADVTDDELLVEATTGIDDRFDVAWHGSAGSKRFAVLHIVPTGIGCSVGGFAGDAGPANALLASGADIVLTNPNTVNASSFINLPENVLYTEGYLIDHWVTGRLPLFSPKHNRIGVVIEACDERTMTVVTQVIDTARTVHGVDVVGFVTTPESIGTTCELTASGAYVGCVKKPAVLLEAVGKLVASGANAISVTSKISGLDRSSYAKHFRGVHPNPVGGAEAVLSHLVVSATGIPCAHAPIINFRDFGADADPVDPRGAGEIASESGLACVLVGLRQSPQIRQEWGGEEISRHDLGAVVVPATALGGVPSLQAARTGTPVIAVEENHTVLKVTAGALNLPNVVEVGNYLEAAGAVQAIRAQIAFAALRRPVENVRALA